MKIAQFLRQTKHLPDHTPIRFSCMKLEATNLENSHACWIYPYKNEGIDVVVNWNERKCPPLKYVRDIVMTQPDMIYKSFFYFEDDRATSDNLTGIVIDKDTIIFY